MPGISAHEDTRPTNFSQLRHIFAFDRHSSGWLTLTSLFYIAIMIGTIRKHSKLLWWTVGSLTVVSFLWWGAAPSRTGGRGEGDTGNYGKIYGRKITPEAFRDAEAEVYLDYFFKTGAWPNKNQNISKKDLDEQIYVRLMLVQKAEDLGIYISDATVAAAAIQVLHSLGRNGQAVPMNVFVKQILQPESLTAGDFKNYIRHDMTMGQLRKALGLAGEFVTPQEAAAVYERQNQELSVEAVFFSASNYLASVAMTPAAVAQFYTNHLAEYRLPDRVQVNYVAFEATNFRAEAEQKLSKTNLNEQVEAVYAQYGGDIFPEAKTPDEKKAKIRQELILGQALVDARRQANEFANAVFSQEPVRPENLAAIAKQKGLTVRVTAPFSKEHGPEEFVAPENFIKTAFKLSVDEPLAGPVAGPDAVFVLALDKQLPSEIPSLDTIRARVTQDCQFYEATLLARAAGTNFVHTLTNDPAGGKSFASVCIAAGLHPEVLPPISLSTRELPEVDGRANLNQLKQTVFSTSVGKTSRFVETDDGGFIVFVQSLLPLDQAAMDAGLPRFAASLREQRQTEAFYQWLNLEAGRQLRDTPVFQESSVRGTAPAK